MGMQLVGTGNDQNLWHTIRNANGSWQQHILRIETVVAGGPNGFQQAGSGSVDTKVIQLVGVGNDGKLWHTLRNIDSTWQTTFGALAGVVTGGPSTFSAVSCAGADGALQVVGVGDDGKLWHTLRNAAGTWQTPYGGLAGVVSGGPATFSAVSCAGADGALQVVGVGDDGKLWHTLRNAAGTWQTPYGGLAGVVSGGPDAFTAVSCTGADGVLEIVAVGDDGKLWHTLRNAAGTWQTPYGALAGVVSGGPATFSAVSCAGADGALQVVGVGDDGKLWHTLRNAAGRWQTQFGSVDQVSAGGPDAFTTITSSAGADTN